MHSPGPQPSSLWVLSPGGPGSLKVLVGPPSPPLRTPRPLAHSPPHLCLLSPFLSLPHPLKPFWLFRVKTSSHLGMGEEITWLLFLTPSARFCKFKQVNPWNHVWGRAGPPRVTVRVTDEQSAHQGGPPGDRGQILTQGPGPPSLLPWAPDRRLPPFLASSRPAGSPTHSSACPEY